jgi:IS1 family transposase
MIQRLEVEADEMASFIQKKANKQWIWIAMDATSRQVIAFHVGDRSRKSAQQLWSKIPLAYRQHATFYTDQYVVYEGVIARCAAPGNQQTGAQNQSPRAVQQHAASARLPLGARGVVVLQEARQSYRGH